MKYNLTSRQKYLASFLVREARAGNLPECFTVGQRSDHDLIFPELISEHGDDDPDHQNGGIIEGRIGEFDALAASKLLLVDYSEDIDCRRCTLVGLIYEAVDSEFAETEQNPTRLLLGEPHPPEIAISIDRLRARYPDPKRLGFLIMRFTAAKPFERIVSVIKDTAKGFGLIIVRADENEFHADLWGNVRTLLHGCGFGIAVYERIETNEPNANVGLEVGYLMAMNKPVLLLKDKTVGTLQSDLAGKLYKPFDPHDPEGTIPACLTKWLEDNGVIVPKPDSGR